MQITYERQPNAVLRDGPSDYLSYRLGGESPFDQLFLGCLVQESGFTQKKGDQEDSLFHLAKEIHLDTGMDLLNM